jgi:hypothetical protein
MNYLNQILTRLYVDVSEKMASEEGLSAMEYLVMMLGLVLLVFAAFKFAGSQIQKGVQDFFTNVFGG